MKLPYGLEIIENCFDCKLRQGFCDLPSEPLAPSTLWAISTLIPAVPCSLWRVSKRAAHLFFAVEE